MPISEADKLAYSVHEAAQATGLSRARIYQLVAAGQLPARGVGTRRMVIRRSDLQAFIDGLPATTGFPAESA